jgi:23S rRNA (guanosine2251-2'-O)-methyltransferase
MEKPKDESDDFIYGRNPVFEALSSDAGGMTVNKIWILKGSQGGVVQQIVDEAKARKILFQWVDRSRLEEMARGAAHQGVVARVSGASYGTIEDVLAQKSTAPLVLLDGIEDPHNVGAIVRSAAFFGARAVVVPRWRSAGLTGAVVKASAGALAKIPLVQVTNIAQTIETLKENNFWVYGADLAGEPARTISFSSPCALVIGREGEGLHRLVRERCDALVKIEGSGLMESLNASCAASVLLAHLFGTAKS